MIKLKDVIEDLELGKVYTDKDRPPFQVKEETINEAPNSVPRDILKQLGSELNKASDMIIKITDKYKKEGDIEGMVQAWMRGLHLRLKKNGIKI